MNVNSRWFNGPQFLTQRENSWLVDPTLRQQESTDEDPEVKHDLQHCCLALTNQDFFWRLIDFPHEKNYETLQPGFSNSNRGSL